MVQHAGVELYSILCTTSKAELRNVLVDIAISC